MKHTKRILSLLLALAMLVSAMPITAMAKEEENLTTPLIVARCDAMTGGTGSEAVNLTTLGSTDWIHLSVNDNGQGRQGIGDVRKANANIIGLEISDKLSAKVETMEDPKFSYSWTDGTPVEKKSGFARGKIFFYDDTYEGAQGTVNSTDDASVVISVPADELAQTLTVAFGAWASKVKVEVYAVSDEKKDLVYSAQASSAFGVNNNATDHRKLTVMMMPNTAFEVHLDMIERSHANGNLTICGIALSRSEDLVPMPSFYSQDANHWLYFGWENDWPKALSTMGGALYPYRPSNSGDVNKHNKPTTVIKYTVTVDSTEYYPDEFAADRREKIRWSLADGYMTSPVSEWAAGETGLDVKIQHVANRVLEDSATVIFTQVTLTNTTASDIRTSLNINTSKDVEVPIGATPEPDKSADYSRYDVTVPANGAIALDFAALGNGEATVSELNGMDDFNTTYAAVKAHWDGILEGLTQPTSLPDPEMINSWLNSILMMQQTMVEVPTDSKITKVLSEALGSGEYNFYDMYTPSYTQSGLQINKNKNGVGIIENIENGEWITYKNVYVEEDADSITLGMAYPPQYAKGGSVAVYVDDAENPTATLTAVDTGDWQVYQDVTAECSIPAGYHDITLKMVRSDSTSSNIYLFNLMNLILGEQTIDLYQQANIGQGILTLSSDGKLENIKDGAFITFNNVDIKETISVLGMNVAAPISVGYCQGGTVSVFVDDAETPVAVLTATNTDNWDNYVPMIAACSTPITAGTHTITLRCSMPEGGKTSTNLFNLRGMFGDNLIEDVPSDVYNLQTMFKPAFSQTGRVDLKSDGSMESIYDIAILEYSAVNFADDYDTVSMKMAVPNGSGHMWAQGGSMSFYLDNDTEPVAVLTQTEDTGASWTPSKLVTATCSKPITAGTHRLTIMFTKPEGGANQPLFNGNGLTFSNSETSSSEEVNLYTLKETLVATENKNNVSFENDGKSLGSIRADNAYITYNDVAFEDTYSKVSLNYGAPKMDSWSQGGTVSIYVDDSEIPAGILTITDETSDWSCSGLVSAVLDTPIAAGKHDLMLKFDPLENSVSNISLFNLANLTFYSYKAVEMPQGIQTSNGILGSIYPTNVPENGEVSFVVTTNTIGSPFVLKVVGADMQTEYGKAEFQGWKEAQEVTMTLTDNYASESSLYLIGETVYDYEIRGSGGNPGQHYQYDRYFSHDVPNMVEQFILEGNLELGKRILESPYYQDLYNLKKEFYLDAIPKYIIPFATLYQVMSEAEREEFFTDIIKDAIKIAARKIEDYMTADGLMVASKTLDNPSNDYNTVDNFAALHGLAAYIYLCEGWGWTDEVTWATEKMTALNTALNEALDKIMAQRGNVDWYMSGLTNDNSFWKRRQNGTRSYCGNWLGTSFEMSTFPWDAQLRGFELGGTWLEKLDSSVDYAMSLRDEAGDIPKGSWGAWWNHYYGTSYNVGMSFPLLTSEKYRTMGIEAYEWLMENQSAPLIWGESFDQGMTASDWTNPAVDLETWALGFNRQGLLRAIISVATNGDVIIGRGIPTAWNVGGTAPVEWKNVLINDGKKVDLSIVTSSDGKTITVILNGDDADGNIIINLPVLVNNIASASDGIIDQTKGTVTCSGTVKNVVITLKDTTGEVDDVTAVEEMIEALGTVTLESKDAVEAARAAYNNLNDEQKAQVNNYDVLEAAEKALATLQLEATKAVAVKELEEAAAVDTTDFTDASKAALNEAVASAKNAIMSANDEADVKTALEDGKAAVEAVITAAILAGAKEAALAAKAAAEEAQAAAEAAQAVAETAAETAADDRAAAEAAMAAAEEAQAKAEEAQAAAKAAKEAAEKSDADAAKSAAEAAAKAAEAAAKAAEAAQAQASAQAAQAAAEAAEKAAEEAAAQTAADKAAAEAAKDAAETAKAAAEAAKEAAAKSDAAAAEKAAAAAASASAAAQAQASAQAAQAAAEAAEKAAEEAAAQTAADKTAADAAKAAAELAQSRAEIAQKVAEAAQAAAEAADAQAAANAAKTAADAAKTAADAAEAAKAQAAAQIAQSRAEAAQAAAEAARAKADEAASKGEAFADEAEAAKKAAVAAQEAAEAAKKAAAVSADAAKENNAAAAEAAAQAAKDAAAVADALKEVAADKAAVAADKAEVAKMLEAVKAAELGAAKSYALTKLALAAAEDDNADPAKVVAGSAAIEAAEDIDAVDAALAAALADLDYDVKECPSEKFTDAPAKDNWAHEGIDYCIANGYMNGTSETIFSPNGTVTRAQLVTILYRVADEPATEFKGTFSDVEDGLWYSDAIEWAAANEVVNGVGEGKFNPMGAITREQIAAILYRYSKAAKVEGDLKAFPDGDTASSYAIDALVWAVDEGLITGIKSGDVTILAPKDNATRAQIASIIMRFIEK